MVLDYVFPLLNDINIYVVGKICDFIDDMPNIIKLGMVDDLDSVYKSTKICICPMVTGTGVKIKVLESLSYGLPVVTTRRGVDGLVNKSQNGCIVSDEPLIFADNIKNYLMIQIYTQKFKMKHWHILNKIIMKQKRSNFSIKFLFKIELILF